MKKLILFFMIFFLPINVFADSGKSTIVMDIDSGRILYEKNVNQKRLIASITKIMTCIIVLENCDIESSITVGGEVLSMYGTNIYIEKGEVLRIQDLLYGLMLRSGNDAAYSLAFNVGSSMEGFALLMNELGKNIGMNDTIFVNSSGLEDSYGENYSTVYDMALLSSYAIKNDIYKKIVGTKEYTVKTNLKTYIWHNKNKLLSSYKYCIGGKTGFTEKARRTLVTNASKNNINLTVVTFNDSDDFNTHKYLYEKYFNKLKSYKLLSKGRFKTNLDNTYIENDYYMSLTSDEYKKIKLVINYYNNNVTNIIGTIEIMIDDKIYHQEKIIVKDNKKETISFKDKIKNKIKSIWFK